MIRFTFATDRPLKILCLGAHPDDIELGCGATLLKIISSCAVDKIKWIVFTSNKLREKEARQSAKMFLSMVEDKDIIVKNFKDGFLPFSATEIKEYFEEIKHEFNPDIIFTHFRNDRHQDHRLVSDFTWNTWRNNLIMEYEIHKYDGDLSNPNFYVPLEEKFLNKRNNILLTVFKSQTSKQWFDELNFKALPRLRGVESAKKFAEAFYVRKIIL